MQKESKWKLKYITNNIKTFAIVYDLFTTQILDPDIFNVKVI